MPYQELLSATAVPLGTRPDGTLRTLIDPTTLLYDSFETLDTTNTWVIGGTVLPTGAAGQLTLAPGITANASSFARSQPAFIPSSNGWLVYASLYQLEVGAVTGNKRVWGLGVYITPTFAVPVTNGVVFEIETTTGALQASVYSNSVRTTVVPLIRPTDGLPHRYAIIYRGSRVYFDIDGVTVATIQNPSLQVSALSLINVSINDAVAPLTAPVLISTLNGLADSGRNATKIADGVFPWRVQTVKAASTAVLSTDLPAVVALHPGSPTPNFLAPQAVTGPLTDTQLRATAVNVTMVNTLALTDTQIRATPLPISGIVTANATLSAETTKVIGTVINAPSANVIGRVGIDQTTLGNTNAVQAIPGITNGLTTFHLISAASVNATNIKASAGQIYGWYIYNSNSAARKLNFHNTAGIPTAGVAVFFSLNIPPFSGANVHMSTGISFSAGIAITTTTTVQDGDASLVALNDMNINIFYK